MTLDDGQAINELQTRDTWSRTCEPVRGSLWTYQQEKSREEPSVCGEHHQRWEYRVASDLDEIALNGLGGEGWELVGINRGAFYLKRPELSFRERVTLEQKQRYYALWSAAPSEGTSR
jgi:hypothetical protein